MTDPIDRALDESPTWWPLLAARPREDEDIPVELSLKLAAVQAPLAMGCLSVFVALESSAARAHFARAFPAIGLLVVAVVVALRLAFAWAWNARARRLRGE